MKKISIILFLLSLVSTASKAMDQQTMLDYLLYPIFLVQTEVVTVQGFVEYFDKDSMEIRIDGNNYQLHRKTRVISKDKTIDINKISIGDFVIATIKKNFILQIELIPKITE
jgi:hypothetical protein